MGSGTTPPKGKRPHTGGRAPVSWQKRRKVAELHAQGYSRNRISRELGISTAIVTRIAAEAGLSFDRTITRAATEAVMDDLKTRRGKLAVGLLDDIDRLRPMLFESRLVVGKYDQISMVEPTTTDVKNLLISIGIALDKHIALTKLDSDDRDLPAVDAWLQSLGV